MKKLFKWVLAAAVVVFVLMQFANPARTNPPVAHDLMATSPAPPPVAAMLHAACYDCHSYETKWPWYSHVAPASWLVANDVDEGRKHLNLSDWFYNQPDRAARKLENMGDNVQDGDMPPSKYTLLHPDARLTAAQRDQLAQWANGEAARLKAAMTAGTNEVAK
jgi:hypothetical protein